MKNQVTFTFSLLLLLSRFATAQPVIGISTFSTNTTVVYHSNSACVSTKTASLEGWLFSVSSTSNCGINQTNSSGGDGRLQYLVGFGTLSEASFSSVTGSEFALTNLTWGVSTTSWTSVQMTFTGFKNGSPVPGATLSATTPSATGVSAEEVVSFTNNIAFKDVDDIRLTSPFTCNSILFIEDITIAVACSALNTSTSVTNLSCNGGGNGSATVTASGGTGPYTYSWSTGVTTSVVTNIMAGIYSVQVTDANTCTSTKSVTITQPSALNTSTSVTNLSCNGGGNGSATVTASGGTGPYTYSWSTGVTTSVVTNIMAGIYSVQVTDANNCSNTKSVTITQPSALNTSTSVTNLSCNGGGNGSATVTASGGTGPYTYSWSTGVTTSVVTNIMAGIYSVQVTDANNCSNTKSVTITQPSALNTSTSVTNLSCNGGGNGSATVTASGGTGPYTYSWSTGVTTSVVTNIMAGTYSVQVTDANTCTSTKSVTITQPTALNTSTGVTNLSCNGGGNGSATVTASGGTGSFTYSWSTGATTSVVTNIMAGTYSVLITDANTCTSTKSVTITQPTALNTSTGVTNLSCNGGGNGSATVTASGGTGPYTYSWSTGVTASVVTNIMAGTYSVLITDANTCTSTKSVTITQPAAIITSTAVTNLSCNGGSTGSATVGASGGAGSFTYSWSTGVTTSVVTNIMAGTYSVLITDANTCTSTKSVTITQPPALVIAINANPANLCVGNTATLNAIGSGGTGIITHSWISGPATASIAVSPSTSSVFTANVTDANNCVVSGTIALTVIPISNISANSGSICVGQSFTINPSGATSYTYSGGSAIVSPATTSSYTLTATDSNSCTTNPLTVTVTVNPQPTITVNSGSICAGGSYTVIPSGANTYTITGNTLTVSPMVTTSYSLTGTSMQGCQSSNTAVVAVTVNTVPAVAAASGSICAGGSYTVIPSGANTYSITGNTLTVSPMSTTDYSVTGTSMQGCQSSNTAVVTVSVNTVPVVAAASGSICVGGSYTVIPSGANTYTITGNTLTVSPMSTTDYSVTGTSMQGCQSSNTAVVTVSVNTVPVVAAASGSICTGGSYTVIPSGANTYSITGNTLTVSPMSTTDYSLTGTSMQGCQSSNTAVVTVSVNTVPVVAAASGSICTGGSYTVIPSGANTYTITGNTLTVSPMVTNSYSLTGTSMQGCQSSNTAVVTVTVNSRPIVGANSGSICTGGSFTITPTGANTYTVSGNTLTVSPAVTTTFYITGTDANGCVSNNTAESTVTVNTRPSLSVNVTNTVVCPGTSFSLTASGAGTSGTYTWNGTTNANSLVITPTVNASYTVNGTSAQGCAAVAAVVSTVNVNSTPTIAATSGSICSGKSHTFTPSGATSYTYTSPSSTVTGTTTVVSPTVTTSYTISGKDANGCVSSPANNAVAGVTVLALPILTLAATPTAVCNGSLATITASGASTYTWNTAQTGSAVAVGPTVATTYTVTGTGANNCTVTSTRSVAVNPIPTITINSGTLCTGYVFTLTPGGASTYSYAGGSNTVSPTTITNYTVLGTSSLGCVAANPATSTVTVNQSPTISATSGSICAGESFTLSPTGAATYVIAGNTSTNVVTPQFTSTYSITGTATNNCTSPVPAIATVTVHARPNVTAVAAATAICAGQSTSLNASGATTYTWMPGNSTLTSINVSPLTTSVYTISGTNTLGCSNNMSVTVTVNQLPAVNISASNTFVCAGGSATLTAGGASTYVWNTSNTTAIISVTPASNSTYTVTGTDGNGCVKSNTMAVVVNTLSITSTADTSVCWGSNFTLTAGGAVSYTWNGTHFFGNYPITPTATAVYTVVGLDTNNCVHSRIVSIGIYQLPVVNASASRTLMCINESATITASGANSYQWSGSGTGSGATIVITPTIDITHDYTVTGSNANNCKATATVQVKVDRCDGVEEQGQSGIAATLYPNPNNGEFTLNIATAASVRVTNTLGQVVYAAELKAGENKIKLESLHVGVYFVNITKGTSTKTIKVIKD